MFEFNVSSQEQNSHKSREIKLMYSFNRHLLNNPYGPNFVLDTGNPKSLPQGVHSLEERNNQTFQIRQIHERNRTPNGSSSTAQQQMNG